MRTGVYSIILAFIIISGCKDPNEPSSPSREYELVWSDEFEGDAGSKVDPTFWTYDLGKGNNGWGNN